MKKIYYLFFAAVLSVSFSSCKKDKVVKKPALISNDISGNWKLSSVTKEYILGVKSVATVNHYLPADTIDHLTFKADGTGTIVTKGDVTAIYRYDATDSVIHFVNVVDPITHDYIGTGAFVLFITQLDKSNMETTSKWFPSYGVYFYGNDRYDQIQTHTFFKKE